MAIACVLQGGMILVLAISICRAASNGNNEHNSQMGCSICSLTRTEHRSGDCGECTREEGRCSGRRSRKANRGHDGIATGNTCHCKSSYACDHVFPKLARTFIVSPKISANVLAMVCRFFSVLWKSGSDLDILRGGSADLQSNGHAGCFRFATSYDTATYFRECYFLLPSHLPTPIALSLRKRHMYLWLSMDSAPLTKFHTLSVDRTSSGPLVVSCSCLLYPATSFLEIVDSSRSILAQKEGTYSLCDQGLG
ncbi:unnamed protein product [Chondrus crispus]|uniref:Uncharacterized protein n=1 Tax=Chondrus crispus TaxID=2769 RepID=R7Q7A6_CHOCR|nr:unnamed protein product [Chondrus crispus]CDF33266.1 unnamed protein product [Chondrus crispus]|eukprot:XP_005713069.1 unnamed protein product [Chondrus crispus]